MKRLLNSKLILYIPLLIIMIISFFNMYNARFINPIYNNHLSKQIIWYIIGIILFIIVSKINANILFKYSKYLYLISTILLFIVLFKGRVINGSRAWLSIGNISFQPSEIMKICLSFYLIYIISTTKNELLLIFKSL